MTTHSSILAWRIHGQRSLAGYSLWGHKESDMPCVRTHFIFHVDMNLHFSGVDAQESDYWVVY